MNAVRRGAAPTDAALGSLRSLAPVLALLLGLLLGGRLLAAEDPLAAEALARQQQAENDLAGARAGILQERQSLAAALEAKEQELGQLRQQLAQATRERDAALADAAKARQAADQERLATRLQVDRVVIAAHLPPAQEHALATAAPAERLRAALAGLAQRLAQLPGHLALSLASEPVIARDGQQATVPVLRLGQARAVAIGTTAATRGILTPTKDGALEVVAGATLPESVSAAGTLALVPLDPDNTLASQQVAERTIGDWLRAGRFFIWPILAVLVIGLGIALERALTLAGARVDPRRLATVLTLVREDQPGRALALVGGATPLDRVLRHGLEALGLPRPAREAALEESMLSEAPRLQRGLGLLMVLASIAPLLGLLGTVTGMIDMFRVIAAHGSGNARSLSGSISEALVTTQAGMIVAVPLLVIHALLARSVEKRLMTLEEGGMALLAIDPPSGKQAAAPAPLAALPSAAASAATSAATMPTPLPIPSKSGSPGPP